MRLSSATTLVRLMVGCGVVAGHQRGHHGGADGGKHVPLHEREYIQDSVEELERKWSFEVRCVFSACFLCDFFSGNCGLGDFLESRECPSFFLTNCLLGRFLAPLTSFQYTLCYCASSFGVRSVGKRARANVTRDLSGDSPE
jgi:hypothetical protein